MRRFLPAVMVFGGFVAIATAAFFIHPSLGIAVMGAASIWAGLDLRSNE